MAPRLDADASTGGPYPNEFAQLMPCEDLPLAWRET
jgi:hypothetical protein